LAGKSNEAIQSLAKAAPLERLGQPQDIAETVAHLSNPARWINGQVIFANGGLA
jgi:3-oxoacyl-[acyl-carrier protein] reductase